MVIQAPAKESENIALSKQDLCLGVASIRKVEVLRRQYDDFLNVGQDLLKFRREDTEAIDEIDTEE
ncbi:hypothetical protein EIP86_009076 [Pleurotus ostreatoroseus]|nr:hypothetical protein EIP86_009076 [Pleurotus ostreatoroseus]